MARIKHKKNYVEFDDRIVKSFPSLLDVYLENDVMKKSSDHPKSSPAANAIATRPTFLGGGRRGKRTSKKSFSKSSIDDVTLMDVFLGQDLSKANGPYDDHPASSHSATQIFVQPRYSGGTRNRPSATLNPFTKFNEVKQSGQTIMGKQSVKTDSESSKKPKKSKKNKPRFTPSESRVSETSSVDNVQTPKPTNNNNIHPLPLPVDFSNPANAKNPVNPNRKLNQWGEEMKSTDPDEEFFFSLSGKNYRQRGKR